MRQLHEISNAESLGDAIELMVAYPEAVAQVTVSSIGRFTPALAATAGVGAATGGATMPLMASTFMGSLGIEYAATMDETIREAGYDPEDPRAWQKAVSDQEMLDHAKERGLKRGIPIAAFDAISMGLAGKLLAGAKPTATSILSRSAGELAQQSAAGAAGEAAAQYVETGDIESIGEVALEGVAELGPGVIETAIGYKGAKEQALRKLMAEQAGYDAARREGDRLLTPDFEVKSLEENENAIDQALAQTPPSPDVEPGDRPIDEIVPPAEEPIEEAQLDPDEQQAEDEANAWVMQQLRERFPDASEEELLAAVEVAKPKIEPQPAQPETTDTDTDLDLDLDEEAVEQLDTPVAAPPEDQASEPIEETGWATATATEYATKRPEFKDLILSFRPGDDRDGETMPHYYGEIAGTEDADGMAIDVLLNKDYNADEETPVFIVNQLDWDSGEFRQHKVFAGFDDVWDVEQSYADTWDGAGMGDVFN